jgi:GTP-binding protein
MKVLCRFVISAADPAQFPAPGPPEIAFLGRSNVGKSSVINNLLATKIAKTSSTPGRTRTINFFEVRWPGRPRPDLVFADLPGYGYAKLPREISAEWPKFIEPYLEERPNLALCVVLADVRVPPQPSDQQLIEWLRAKQRQFLVVATKADRLSGNTLRHATQQLCAALGVERVLPFSAKTRQGRDELWREILAAAGVASAA